MAHRHYATALKQEQKQNQNRNQNQKKQTPPSKTSKFAGLAVESDDSGDEASNTAQPVERSTKIDSWDDPSFYAKDDPDFYMKVKCDNDEETFINPKQKLADKKMYAQKKKQQEIEKRQQELKQKQLYEAHRVVTIKNFWVVCNDENQNNPYLRLYVIYLASCADPDGKLTHEEGIKFDALVQMIKSCMRHESHEFKKPNGETGGFKSSQIVGRFGQNYVQVPSSDLGHVRMFLDHHDDGNVTLKVLSNIKVMTPKNAFMVVEQLINFFDANIEEIVEVFKPHEKAETEETDETDETDD